MGKSCGPHGLNMLQAAVPKLALLLCLLTLFSCHACVSVVDIVTYKTLRMLERLFVSLLCIN
jgi:ABC-type proline/glycine betaine transport system permease subunit